MSFWSERGLAHGHLCEKVFFLFPNYSKIEFKQLLSEMSTRNQLTKEGKKDKIAQQR